MYVICGLKVNSILRRTYISNRRNNWSFYFRISKASLNLKFFNLYAEIRIIKLITSYWHFATHYVRLSQLGVWISYLPTTNKTHPPFQYKGYSAEISVCFAFDWSFSHFQLRGYFVFVLICLELITECLHFLQTYLLLVQPQMVLTHGKYTDSSVICRVTTVSCFYQ